MGRLRFVCLPAVASLMVLGAVQVASAADADVIGRFGMLGRMAIDCSAPYSEANPYLTYAASGDGNVTRSLKMAPDLDGTFAMRNLRMAGPDVLQYDETGRASELTISIIKQRDGKFRSWRSVRTSGPKNGEVLIENGKFGSGAETLAFSLCP